MENAFDVIVVFGLLCFTFMMIMDVLRFLADPVKKQEYHFFWKHFVKKIDVSKEFGASDELTPAIKDKIGRKYKIIIGSFDVKKKILYVYQQAK